MNKKTVTIIAIGLFVIIIVVATVFVSRTKTKQGSSSYSAAATETYAEDFSSAAFRDAGNTTADWDTDRGVLTLPRTAGAFYYADESTEGLETVFSPSIGNAPLPMTVSFDSLGQPYVAFRHYDFDTDLAQVLVGHWDRATGAWVKADGSAGFDQFGTTNRGAFGDLDLTSNDEPAVAWHEYDSGTTTHSYFYTRWDSAQGAFVKANGSPGSDLVTTETLDPLEGAPQERWVDLELDSQGRPNIAFMSWDSTGSDSETSFLRWDGSAYSSIGSANVSNNSGDTDEIVASFINRPEIVLALDSSDRPYILWVDDTAGVNDMFLVYGDSTTNNWKDITGAPYSEACLGTTCSATNLTSTASAGVLGGDIYFNSQGDPAVVWSELGSTTLTEIFYQRWDSATSTWRGADGSAGAQEATSSAVVAAAGGARNPSVRFDTRDYPVISYDASDVFLSIDVFVTRWNGTVFATVDGATPGATNVTNYGSTGLNWRTPLLALDALGNPAMTWKLTSPSLMLGFTHWLEPCEASSTAQSTSVITSQEPVLSATLETDATTNGGTITYQLSNDGGLTFSNVTPGTPHVFETIGSDVKWRSDITRGSTPGACPVIDALSINASTSPIVRIDSATPTEQSIKISRIRFPETGSSPVGLIARNDIYA
ncbi:MAG: hypothetical protein Q8P33_02860, partial [bacterium]|nr:hypothetical protein [bacterium]